MQQRSPRPSRMRQLAWALPCAVLLLSACGSGPGGVVRRINPPVAAIQRLEVAPDGAWAVLLRINNFSTVPMRFERVAAELTVGGAGAGSIDAPVGLEIPGQSSDVFRIRLEPAAAAASRLADAEASGSGTPYVLDGRIITSEPNDRFDFRYESRLAPVPGRPGEFR